MYLLIILMSIWLGLIPWALQVEEAAQVVDEAEVAPVAVVASVDYSEPCYNAPCSDTCMHGASDNAQCYCVNIDCPHNMSIYTKYWSECCGKKKDSNLGEPVSLEDRMLQLVSCNGFKREDLKCKLPEYRT